MGEIFSPDFTGKMKQTSKKLNLSERIMSLFTFIHEESVCPDLKQRIHLEKQAAVEKVKEEQNATENSISTDSAKSEDDACNGRKTDQTVPDGHALDKSDKSTKSTSVKRTIEALEDCDMVVRKKMRLDCDGDRDRNALQAAPQFFYNPTKRKIKAVDIPK